MEKGTITVNGIKFPTLLAISEAEQMRGLMHCEDLPPSMSFVYDRPKVNKFWMKNTPKALDIVFCVGGKIAHIAKGEPLSTSMIGPDFETDLVVEFPHGTCKRFGITEGHVVDLPEVKSKTLFSKSYY